MNCEPGDLAITFGAPLDNGILVEVSAIEKLPPGLREDWGPFWLVRSLGSPFQMTPHRLSETAIWPDRLLRPIRDPGDDAVDETLQRLPAPTRDEVAA